METYDEETWGEHAQTLIQERISLSTRKAYERHYHDYQGNSL